MGARTSTAAVTGSGQRTIGSRQLKTPAAGSSQCARMRQAEERRVQMAGLSKPEQRASGVDLRATRLRAGARRTGGGDTAGSGQAFGRRRAAGIWSAPPSSPRPPTTRLSYPFDANLEGREPVLCAVTRCVRQPFDYL